MTEVPAANVSLGDTLCELWPKQRNMTLKCILLNTLVCVFFFFKGSAI